MSKITLPPLPAPEYPAVRLGINRDKLAYTAEQMQERDRQIVRACADRLRSDGLRQDTRERTHAFFDAADAILALLPVKEPQA